jgi:predicted nuclease of predicted toxin-antitoxin system
MLVDESVTKDIRKWLKKQGFDTLNASDTNLKGAKDQDIAQYAVKNSMTILTLDV